MKLYLTKYETCCVNLNVVRQNRYEDKVYGL